MQVSRTALNFVPVVEFLPVQGPELLGRDLVSASTCTSCWPPPILTPPSKESGNKLMCMTCMTFHASCSTCVLWKLLQRCFLRGWCTELFAGPSWGPDRTFPMWGTPRITCVGDTALDPPSLGEYSPGIGRGSDRAPVLPWLPTGPGRRHHMGEAGSQPSPVRGLDVRLREAVNAAIILLAPVSGSRVLPHPLDHQGVSMR